MKPFWFDKARLVNQGHRLEELKAIALDESTDSIRIDQDDPRWIAKVEARRSAANRKYTCVHRGELIGKEPCPTCTGHVLEHVFACKLHGSCTIARPIEGKKMCLSCPDRAPACPTCRAR